MSRPEVAIGPDRVRSGGWWALALLVALYIQSFVDRTILSALGEPIRHELGLTDLQVGLLGGLAFALTYSALGVPAALLSERIQRKTLIAVATLIWSAMTMACGAAGGFLSLLLMRAGVGIGEAGFTPPAHALISDFFPPKRRAFALALFSASVPIGVLVAAIGGSWLAQNLGWRQAFVAVGLPGLILGPLIYFTMREPGRGEAEGSPPEPAVRLRKVAGHLFAARSALPLILAGSFAAVPGYALFTFGTIFFVRVHELSLVAASTAFGAVVAGGQFLGMIGGGGVIERLARARPSALLWAPALALLASSAFQIAAWLQGDLVGCLVLLAFGMILGAAYLGPSYAAVHALLTARMRAGGMAIVLLLHTIIALGLGPPLIGLVSDFFAAKQFGPGFAETCGRGGHLPASLPTACSQASEAGIIAALCFASLFAVLAAAAFGFASRSFAKDTARTSPQDGAGQ